MEYGLGEWEGLSSAFADMFEGLGEVKSDGSRLEFTSFPSDVATGLSISRDGSMLANMPLHGIDSRFERVIFDERRESIRLIGPETDYTYRVPPAILRRRGRLRGLSRLWRLR